MDESRFDQLARSWDVAPMHIARTNDIAQAMRTLPIGGRRALEVGAGTGLLSFALSDLLGPVVATDPSAGMVEALQGKIDAAQATSITATRCGDDLQGIEGTFGLVMLQMALHHIPDVPGFLARAMDRLAPDGILAIADLDTEDGSFHGPEVTDVHFGFDRGILEEQLASLGFHDIHFQTPHVMERPSPDGLRAYPIFLLVATRK
ncbi:MAG: class I SAM-dependent methyltransferase [Fibrobacteria bacterium]|nr:class I SAM-dependent methyltransferase [Fibrobacteria bacterium]